MKVIVAGSRHINKPELVDQAIAHAISTFKINITELVEGEAKGVDTFAKRWAKARSITVKPFPAKWEDVSVPGAIVKTSLWGRKYNVRAGYDRNQLMANYGELLIAIWDGNSGGTKNMVEQATNKGLPVYLYMTTPDYADLMRGPDGNPTCIIKS